MTVRPTTVTLASYGEISDGPATPDRSSTMDPRLSLSSTLLTGLRRAVQRLGNAAQRFKPILVTVALLAGNDVPELRARQTSAETSGVRCLTEVPVSAFRNRSQV